MKKKIIIVVVAIALVIVGYLAWEIYIKDFIKESQHNNNRINNCKTLSQYVEYHEWGYTDATQNYEDGLDFYAKDIKFDLLNKGDILYYQKETDIEKGLLILDDYTIYETSFKSDKVYSNGQQYKQIGTDIQVKRVQIQDGLIYLISEDDNYYKMVNISEIQKIERKDIYNSFIEDESIIEIQSYHKPTDDGKIKRVFLTLKTDGQIYEQEYETKYNIAIGRTDTIFKNEKVLFSNKDYGHITDFKDKQFSNYDFNGVTKIVSDKGLFYVKQTNDQQYIDTEPTYEMVESDIYNKYKSDISFINTGYVFTTDNNIIVTEMLCKDIDKEVK